MNTVLLIIDVYIAAQIVWLYLVATNRARNSELTPYLSQVCSPFCRLFYRVELVVHDRNMSRAVPVMTLILVRFVLSAFN